MLKCDWCNTDVTDMPSMLDELSKPDGSMCTECEEVHADIINTCDEYCIENGMELLPDDMRDPNPKQEED